MKTIIHTAPGPTYKGIVRIPTGVLYETEWLEDRSKVKGLCDDFKVKYQPIEIIRNEQFDF